jgi:methylase of polypeptide subunit release factors
MGRSLLDRHAENMSEMVFASQRLLVLRRSLVRLWLALRYRIFNWRYNRLVIEHIDNVPLIVLPDVFNPVLFRTGEILARAVQTTSRLDDAQSPPPFVLDLGCGCGAGAVFAARHGARIVAVDLNPEAVHCVKLNALLNHFEDRIEARLGDIFEPVMDQRFDLILFNPPFYRGQPRNNLDMAWRGEGILERFAAGLKDHLTPSGCAFVVLSTDGEYRAALDALKANEFIVTPTVQRDFGNEVITVYTVTRL